MILFAAIPYRDIKKIVQYLRNDVHKHIDIFVKILSANYSFSKQISELWNKFCKILTYGLFVPFCSGLLYNYKVDNSSVKSDSLNEIHNHIQPMLE